MKKMKNLIPVVLLSFAVLLILGMANNQRNIHPRDFAGAIYFSNGASIEKLDLVTLKKQTIIPPFDFEGEPANTLYPVFLDSPSRMYFLRTFADPSKWHVGSYDLEKMKEVDRLDINRAVSISRDGARLAYFRKKETSNSYLKDKKPSELVVQGISNGQPQIIAQDAFSYLEPPRWLTEQDIVYRAVNDEIIQVNIHTLKKTTWPLARKVLIGPLSADGKFLLCLDEKGKDIYLLNVVTHSMKLLAHSFFLIQSVDLWAPDGKSFIYTRHDWRNFIPYQEVGHLYWRDIESGKEIKLADNVALFGAFWSLKTEAKGVKS